MHCATSQDFLIVCCYTVLLEEFSNCSIQLHAMCMTKYIMSIQIWMHHATIDAINMVPGINHICIHILCACATPFHVGVGGGDMWSLAHHVTCNVFEKTYIWSDRIKLSHAPIAAFGIAQRNWYMHNFPISLHTYASPFIINGWVVGMWKT